MVAVPEHPGQEPVRIRLRPGEHERVQDPIPGERSRGQAHPAVRELTVPDDHAPGPMLVRPPVDHDLEQGSLGTHVRRPEPDEPPGVAHPTWQACSGRRRQRVQPDLGDVVRVSDLRLTVAPADRDLHDVELVGVLAEQMGRRTIDVSGQAEAPHQIAARPGGDHREHRRVHDRPAVAEHAVHDVLDRRIVTDRGDVPVALIERRRRQARDLARCRSHLHSVFETAQLEGLLHGSHLGCDAPLARPRVHDDGKRTERARDGAHGGHRSYTPV